MVSSWPSKSIHCVLCDDMLFFSTTSSSSDGEKNELFDVEFESSSSICDGSRK
jgi:hypothetical protein